LQECTEPQTKTEWNQGLTFSLRKIQGLNRAERICLCHQRPHQPWHSRTPIHTRALGGNEPSFKSKDHPYQIFFLIYNLTIY